MKSKVIVGKYKSEEVIYHSSSGGAFTVLYEYAIAHGYAVYGVKFDNEFKVRHSRATTIKECEKFRKSKYVFSDLKPIYQMVAQDLKNQNSVLFTGTPCQCVAIRNYMRVKNIDISRLLLVDLICHGAPNQKIFDEYRFENQKLMDDEWSGFQFRYKGKNLKNKEVNSRSAELYYKKGKFSYRTMENDPFLKGYYNRLFYRKSCAECPFAVPDRVSDITVGDAWGIEKSKTGWNPVEGVSLILLNSSKGKQLLPEFDKKMDLIESDIEWAVCINSQLGKPTEMHANRNLFFKLLPEVGFQNAVEKSTKISLWKRVIRKMKKILKNVGGIKT